MNFVNFSSIFLSTYFTKAGNLPWFLQYLNFMDGKSKLLNQLFYEKT